MPKPPTTATPQRRVPRTKSAEDFAMAFGEVELHLEGPDDTTPLAGPGPDYEELADFSEYWANSGLPPKDPQTQPRWNKQQQQQQHAHPSSQFRPPTQPQQQQQHVQQQQQQAHPHPMQQRSMLSGATSPTEAGTDTGTQASESWAGTVTADDIVSTLSNDTDDCDTASRSSVKRRRMTQNNSSSSFGFQPLEQVNETGDATAAAGNATGGGGTGNENEPDVRPWKVDIPDHDVVLGDTHEPTWGTKIYREIRKPYAKKTITNEQLKHVKLEFQRRLEKELGKNLPCPPRFWCNKNSTAKTKQIPVSGFLKNRPGITYAYAKDQAIKEDIKNASARPRTRMAKYFTFKGSLEEVVERAVEACDAWVGEDIDKELYAKGFKEDIQRMIPWRGEYVRKKETCEQKAACETVMRGTHMREARIHEAHANHLELAMVEMINQLGNMMIESHRADNKKGKSGPGSATDMFSVEDSSAGGSRNSKARSSSQQQQRRSSAARGAHRTSFEAPTVSTGGGSGGMPPKSKKKPPAVVVKGASAFSPPADVVQDMDVSPIECSKPLMSEHLATGSGGGGAPPSNANGKPRRDLSTMLQTLRMGSLEDIGEGVGNGAPPPLGNVAVVMPPGLPREVRPGGQTADELSVLSAPDDLSQWFMESRESAIRRGIDHPAALPQPGQVADRTKALMQQMKPKQPSQQQPPQQQQQSPPPPPSQQQQNAPK